ALDLFAHGLSRGGFVRRFGQGGVERAHHELITLTYLGMGNERLKVPSRIARAAAGGRLSEANLVLRSKDLGESHAAAFSEIPRLGITVFGKVEDKTEREVGVMRKIASVAGRPVRGANAVLRGGTAQPLRSAIRALPKAMNVERFGLVNVVCPEEAEVIVFPRSAARNALESQLDDPV